MENAAEETASSAAELTWREKLKYQQIRIDALREKLMAVKTNINCSVDDSKTELEKISGRFKAIATLLTYLKSKARIMAISHLAHTSCGITQQDGVGYIDRNGVPLSNWSEEADISRSGSAEDFNELENILTLGPSLAHGADMEDIVKSVRVVLDVMESLVKRVIVAESEAASEKEKVKTGLEEIRKKSEQIENMSAKVEEMERFALGTNSMLNEMRQRVEDMVQETSQQRLRAVENERELSRVKQDFEALRSYVNTLASVREALDRLLDRTKHLENEKQQKEEEVQKLIIENVRLRSMLDQKEAQLVAMNEQCKFLALSRPNP